MSDEVLFTQKLVSKDNDNKVNIEWIVENNTGDFGNFEDGEVKSISFDVELPSTESLKMDFGDDAVIPDKITFGGASLTYLANGVSFKTKSNILEI